MIITVTMNPAVDKTVEVDTLNIGGLNRIQKSVMEAGGKGINVSKTLHYLQKESLAIGVVAGSNGNYIENTLASLNIKSDFLHVQGNTRMNLKVLDQNHCITELNENGPFLEKQECEQIKQKCEQHLKKEDILVISGSVPNQVEETFYYDLIKRAKAKGAKVIFDVDGVQFKEGIKAIPDVVKPNRYELCQYFNVDESIDNKHIVELAKQLIEQGISLVVVSMGKEGAIYVSAKEVLYAQALPIDTYSSVGAGDAMVAAIAYSMENNDSLEEIVRLSIACSAAVVASRNAKEIDKTEIKNLKNKVNIVAI